VIYKWALDKNGSTKAWYVAWLKKARGEKVMKRKKGKLWQKRMYKSWQKKNWRMLTWGLTHENQDPFQLVQDHQKKKKSELILLLKEFKDVFA